MLGLGLEVRLQAPCPAVVPEGPGDLLGELVVQAVDQVADVVLDVADVQVLPAAVAGVEDLAEVVEDLDDLAIARQRRVAEVVDPAAFLVGLDDPLGQAPGAFPCSRRSVAIAESLLLTGSSVRLEDARCPGLCRSGRL